MEDSLERFCVSLSEAFVKFVPYIWRSSTA